MKLKLTRKHIRVLDYVATRQTPDVSLYITSSRDDLRAESAISPRMLDALVRHGYLLRPTAHPESSIVSITDKGHLARAENGSLKLTPAEAVLLQHAISMQETGVESPVAIEFGRIHPLCRGLRARGLLSSSLFAATPLGRAALKYVLNH